MTMDYYAGIDVSLEASSICVVDASGKIVKEAKVSSEPEALIAWFKALPFTLARIGLEAGPLPQWLYAGLKQVGFAAELLETRHVAGLRPQGGADRKGRLRQPDYGADGASSCLERDRQGSSCRS